MKITDRIASQQLLHQINAAAELLPAQGPMTAFAFLNPLQAFESMPFDEAMRRVKRVYGCEPYLEEAQYLAHLQQGRITLADLRSIIASDLGTDAGRCLANLLDRQEFRLSLLKHSIHCGIDRELDWLVAESKGLQFFRPDVPSSIRRLLLDQTRQWVQSLKIHSHHAVSSQPVHDSTYQESKRKIPGDIISAELRSLIFQATQNQINNWDEARWETVCLQLIWDISRQQIAQVFEPQIKEPSVRHRDWLRRVCEVDCDQWVHEILVRFCAAFLDQGFAHWSLPERQQGFFRAFCLHHQQPRMLERKWARGLPAELRRITENGLSPLDSIAESLQLLGVGPETSNEYLQATLLALRGFSGMIWQTEVRPDRVFVPSPAGTLIEYLAVRLILDRLAIGYAARRSLGFDRSLADLGPYLSSTTTEVSETTAEQQAYVIFQLAQLSGWSPERLNGLSIDDWRELSEELSQFSTHERRRIYQAAFDRQRIVHSLDAVSLRVAQAPVQPTRSRLQIVTCINAREESFRRHLEEADDSIETFGIAGFFGVPMYFRGAADAHFASLAPIVVTPKHWVTEEAVFTFEESSRTRARARRIIGSTSQSFHVGTRGSLAGAIVSTLVGPLATAPLLSRVLFPRLTGVLQRTARQFVAPPAVTRLRLERAESELAGEHEAGLGFTVAEMARQAELALRDIGLTKNFAGLVMLLGHGSSCLNNPHESAYHCGACSGSPGGPNARALAVMLNDQRVRRMLRATGIEIPEETFFLGGLHNTATEEITFYDLELLPLARIADFKWAREVFRNVAERNAHERSRRFESAALTLSPFEALLHVQGRTEDLAQTRPEYGNCTNAMCFVGRRARIRGLFMDRRSFLMSYDPHQDDGSCSSLTRILGAVIPVCQGINSLYSFSALDYAGWGSGTKLPHNVTSLLGVMDGAASDLRTGVPWQGIDIHEPVRLLFVIETRPDQLLAIIDARPNLANIVRNQWANFAVLDPDSNAIQQFVDGQFLPYVANQESLPETPSSFDWYCGNRDHLPFARIVKS